MEQVTTPLKVNILRKPIKHIYLRLRSADELEVSAPKRCPQKYIDELIAERHDWITQRRAQLRDTARARPACRYSVRSACYSRVAGIYARLAETPRRLALRLIWRCST